VFLRIVDITGQIMKFCPVGMMILNYVQKMEFLQPTAHVESLISWLTVFYIAFSMQDNRLIGQYALASV
jgi:hypothetical protein